MVKTKGSTMKPWIPRPRRTVRKYQASFLNSSARSVFSISCCATRKQTPIGARWIIHVVIFIITILTLSKNLRRGSPSSPHAAIAMPGLEMKSLDSKCNSACTCHNAEDDESQEIGVVPPLLLVIPSVFVRKICQDFARTLKYKLKVTPDHF